MQPDNFEDISAALALYRPGPMGVNAHTNFALRKNGKQELTPLDPQLEGKLQQEMIDALGPILGTTYGLVIYQEQVMEIAQKLAGYTLGNADLLRRAMGKKKKEVLDAEYVPFSEGMKAKGFNEASIAALWDVLVPFSDYAFNKAHTAAYGLVSYWTGYLKANYPAEYMAALLTSVARRQGQVRALPRRVPAHGHQGAAARRQRVGRPVRRRRHRHPVRPRRRSATSATTSSRRSSRPARRRAPSPRSRTSCPRCPAVVCNKRTIESLIKARRLRRARQEPRGMASTACTRTTSTTSSTSSARRPSARTACSAASATTRRGGVRSTSTVLPPVPAWSGTRQTLLSFEREMLGLYVSDHPLFGIEHVLARTPTPRSPR